VDRARADDDEQPPVLAVEDVAQRLAPLHDQAAALVRERQAGVDFLGRGHGVEVGDVDVVDVGRVDVGLAGWFMV
jgi:hypothetical protein